MQSHETGLPFRVVPALGPFALVEKHSRGHADAPSDKRGVRPKMRVLVLSRGRMSVPHAQSILPVNPQPVAAGRERAYTRPLSSYAHARPRVCAPPDLTSENPKCVKQHGRLRDNSNRKNTSQPTTSPVSLFRGQYMRDKSFYNSRRWRSGRRGGVVAPFSNPNEQAKLFQSSQAEKPSASRAGPVIAAETEGGESGKGGADLQLGKASRVRYRPSTHATLAFGLARKL